MLTVEEVVSRLLKDFEGKQWLNRDRAGLQLNH